MPEPEKPELDLDYILITALLMAGISAMTTVASLLFVRPIATQLGKQLPLPQIPLPQIALPQMPTLPLPQLPGFMPPTAP